MKRVAELTEPPEVGVVYLVPHILAKLGDEVLTLPVLGPAHSDASFAAELGRHIHYDPRFLPDDHVLVEVDGLAPPQVAQVIAHKLLNDPELHELPALCLRQMPEFPRRHPAAPWVPQLERDHRGCRVADGRCPHAGTDGRSFPRRADGSWECIHGLRWAADGSLVCDE